MRTETKKREYCEFCGVDFTNRTYAEKIHHSNQTRIHNAMCHIYSFKECETEKEKLFWLYDSVGLEEDLSASYDSVMEILECLIILYRTKGIGEYSDFSDEDLKPAADYLEKNKNEVKLRFNELIDMEIRKLEFDFKDRMNYLKNLKIESDDE